MATFTDAKDREWSVFIDIPTVKRLREHDLDVLAMFDEGFEVMEKIIGDPIKLVDTLWIILEDQIRERELDEREFGKGLFGDALMRGVNALVEGVCDFFPDPKRREGLRAVFRQVKETEAILLENATAEIQAMDPATVAKAVQSEFGEKSGDSAGSSESTPA